MDPSMTATRWFSIPRTEGFSWDDDPRYEVMGARTKIEAFAKENGAPEKPVNGFKRDRGDGMWVPCNPWSSGSFPVWIWWAK